MWKKCEGFGFIEPQEGKAQEDLIPVFPKGGYKEARGTFFSGVHSAVARGNVHKLKIKSARAIKVWSRLTREVVVSPLLEILETGLDGALDSVV